MDEKLAWLEVSCPSCFARVRYSCKLLRGPDAGKISRKPHDTRVNKAKARKAQ